MSKVKCSKGFTLIELMVVVAILGILTALAAPIIVEYKRCTNYDRYDGYFVFPDRSVMQIPDKVRFTKGQTGSPETLYLLETACQFSFWGKKKNEFQPRVRVFELKEKESITQEEFTEQVAKK